MLRGEELVRPVVLDDYQCAAFFRRQLRRQRVQSTTDCLGHGLAGACHGAIHGAALSGGFGKDGNFRHNIVFLLVMILQAQADEKYANERQAAFDN